MYQVYQRDPNCQQCSFDQSYPFLQMTICCLAVQTKRNGLKFRIYWAYMQKHLVRFKTIKSHQFSLCLETRFWIWQMFLNVVIRKHIQVYPQQWEDLSYCLLKHFRKKCGLGSQGGRTIFYCKKRSFIEIRNPSHSYLFHGIFLQRQKICKGIVSIMGRFWWVNQDNDRRIHW